MCKAKFSALQINPQNWKGLHCQLCENQAITQHDIVTPILPKLRKWEDVSHQSQKMANIGVECNCELD